jgi:high-affinity iron transporter
VGVIIKTQYKHKGKNNMLETLVIIFREALEAFLIIAITLSYLEISEREQLKKPVYAGIATAVVLSLIFGLWLGKQVVNPLTEGIAALIAGVMVISLTFTMLKAGKHMGKVIHRSIDKHINKENIMAFVGIFMFTTLMITREGMEAALLIGTLSAQTDTSKLMTGAFLGMSLAIVIGYLWIKNAHLINLKLFMQVTAIFLIMFSINLMVYGFYEITETAFLPIDNDYWHSIIKPLKKNAIYDFTFAYGLVIVPCMWLAVTMFKNKLSSNKIASA